MEQLLLFLGPDKAGSTFFWESLAAHPAIGTAASKELFYFDRYHELGDTWYEKQFGPGRTKFDCSHDYLFDRQAVERVRRFPAGRIVGVVSLRDPLERAVSAYKYMRWQGRLNSSFGVALEQTEELLSHGDYARWLPDWRTALGSDLLLLDFRTLTSGNADAFNDVLASLGHDLIDSADLASNQNPARESRLPSSIMRLGRAGGDGLRRLGLHRLQAKVKGTVMTSSLLNSPDRSAPIDTLSQAQRSELHARLEEMAHESEGIVNRELLDDWRSSWRSRLVVSC